MARMQLEGMLINDDEPETIWIVNFLKKNNSIEC